MPSVLTAPASRSSAPSRRASRGRLARLERGLAEVAAQHQALRASGRAAARARARASAGSSSSARRTSSSLSSCSVGVAQVVRELGVQRGASSTRSAPAASASASRSSATARAASKPSSAAAARARSTSSAACPARSRGVRHAVPQRERVLEVAQRLAVGVARARAATPAATDAAERPRQVVRAVPVAGELGGTVAAGASPSSSGRARSPAPSAACSAVPLAGQQVLVDRLADERVAEGVGPVGVGDEHAGGRPPRARPRSRRPAAADSASSSAWPIGRSATAATRDDLLSGGRQALEAAEQRVAQRLGQLAGAVGGGGQQLLGVERVALRRARTGGRPGRPSGASPRMPVSCSATSSRLKRSSAIRSTPGARSSSASSGPQRVAAVQLVGAVGGEQEERLRARAADEEDEEVARRGVGPVQVLDHERDGRSRPSRSISASSASNTCGWLAPFGHRLAERPQRLDERRVREDRAAELQAVADEHARAGRAARASNSRHQAALADARLAGHEGEGRDVRRRAPRSSTASSSARPTNVGLETRRSTTSMMEVGSARRGARSPAGAADAEPAGDRGGGGSSRRSPRVKRRRPRPKRRARDALSMRSSMSWAAMTCALSVCMPSEATAETVAAHREVAPT